MQGMYGTLDAELEVQRTIKRAGLTFFSDSSEWSKAPSRFMWTTEEGPKSERRRSVEV